MRMMRFIFLTTSLVILSSSIANGEQCKDQYETIIFPSGMPTSLGWDGESRPAQFKCYAEASLAEDAKAIIFSKEVITGSAENLYNVKLAIISLSAGAKKVIDTVDVTQSIPEYLEMPGNFYKMNAVAETLMGHDNSKILHINIWAVLSGSGATSGSCDLFYIYNSRRLSPVALEIRNSGIFSKENMTNITIKTPQLFLMASGEGTYLYAQTEVVQVKGANKATSSQAASEYLLQSGKFELVKTDARVPSTAVKLERAPEITMLMRTPFEK